MIIVTMRWEKLGEEEFEGEIIRTLWGHFQSQIKYRPWSQTAQVLILF